MSLVQGKGKLGFLTSLTAVLFYYSAMDTWTFCSVVSTG